MTDVVAVEQHCAEADAEHSRGLFAAFAIADEIGHLQLSKAEPEMRRGQPAGEASMRITTSLDNGVQVVVFKQGRSWDDSGTEGYQEEVEGP